jgi:hypothetical protein
MNHFKRMQFVLGAAIMAAIALPADKGFAQGPNDARNPYRLEENWAKLPEGRKWGMTIGIDVDRGPADVAEQLADELERLVDSAALEPGLQREAKRILRNRYSEPDRELALRIHNVAAWSLAFAFGAFVMAILTFWLTRGH